MLAILLTLSFNLLASATFPSTVDDISINNTHELKSETGRVLRGAETRKKIQELVDAGVTDILIFKNDTKGEVAKEIVELKNLGYASANIKSIPFLWKDVSDSVEACKQAITGLQFILKTAAKGGSVYFHCTVGEDRTGLLAGLYQQYVNKWSIEKAYEEELCAHGFASGNPNKPYMVANAVRENLTPVYLLASEVIKFAKASKKALSPSLCETINKSFSAKDLAKCAPSKYAE